MEKIAPDVIWTLRISVLRQTSHCFSYVPSLKSIALRALQQFYWSSIEIFHPRPTREVKKDPSVWFSVECVETAGYSTLLSHICAPNLVWRISPLFSNRTTPEFAYRRFLMPISVLFCLCFSCRGWDQICQTTSLAAQIMIGPDIGILHRPGQGQVIKGVNTYVAENGHAYCFGVILDVKYICLTTGLTYFGVKLQNQ